MFSNPTTQYHNIDPSIEILCYKNGYRGLLLGDSVVIGPEIRAHASTLLAHGGSAIGNSRVKLTNVADCVKRLLVKEGEQPLEVLLVVR
jgi:pyrophosphate--fructose-6-phosphate 1-phosphotransferase